MFHRQNTPGFYTELECFRACSPSFNFSDVSNIDQCLGSQADDHATTTTIDLPIFLTDTGYLKLDERAQFRKGWRLPKLALSDLAPMLRSADLATSRAQVRNLPGTDVDLTVVSRRHPSGNVVGGAGQ